MERVLSPEDRIRRAEELVELRRRTGNYRVYEKDRIQNNDVEDIPNGKIKILKTLITQTVICLIIYAAFLSVKQYNLFFSDEIVDKTKLVLSYDVNFKKVYKDGMNYLQSIYKNNSSGDTTEINQESESTESILEEEKKQEEQKAEEDKKEEVSQMEQDANYIKERMTLTKPTNGYISSEFGEREDENPIVTKVHNGIDIAAVTGTKIKASMDGGVDIATTSSSYGKYIEISNGDVKTIYAHCNKLYVKKGDKVKNGQDIAEVGQTR